RGRPDRRERADRRLGAGRAGGALGGLLLHAAAPCGRDADPDGGRGRAFAHPAQFADPGKPSDRVAAVRAGAGNLRPQGARSAACRGGGDEVAAIIPGRWRSPAASALIIVSTLNNVCSIWAKRAARADIVAILCRLAVIPLELVQRRDGNVTRVAILIRILRYCAPCRRHTNVHMAALRRGTDLRLFQGRLSLTAQLGQFRAWRLRVGRNADSEQRYDRKGWRTGSPHGIPSHRFPPVSATTCHDTKPSNTADLGPHRWFAALPESVAGPEGSRHRLSARFFKREHIVDEFSEQLAAPRAHVEIAKKPVGHLAFGIVPHAFRSNLDAREWRTHGVNKVEHLRATLVRLGEFSAQDLDFPRQLLDLR